MKAIFRVFSAFGVWGWVDIFGALFVAFGCAGELWLLLNKSPDFIEPAHAQKRWEKIFKRLFRPFIEAIVLFLVRRKWMGLVLPKAKEHRLERLFVMLVAFGVALEWFSIPFSLLESAKIAKDAAQARERAAALELQVDELRTGKLPIYRTISPLYSNFIIGQFKSLPPLKVRIVATGGEEILHFSLELEKLIKSVEINEELSWRPGVPYTGVGFEWKAIGTNMQQNPQLSIPLVIWAEIGQQRDDNHLLRNTNLDVDLQIIVGKRSF